MKNNLKLVINNIYSEKKPQHFFEKDELKIILDLYARMVSEGSWKDYGLNISSKQIGFVFLKMLQKMQCIKFVKILNQIIKA